jgi:hypothetical protein
MALSVPSSGWLPEWPLFRPASPPVRTPPVQLLPLLDRGLVKDLVRLELQPVLLDQRQEPSPRTGVADRSVQIPGEQNQPAEPVAHGLEAPRRHLWLVVGPIAHTCSISCAQNCLTASAWLGAVGCGSTITCNHAVIRESRYFVLARSRGAGP